LRAEILWATKPKSNKIVNRVNLRLLEDYGLVDLEGKLVKNHIKAINYNTKKHSNF
jgi:hypothetical protein